MRTTIRVVTAGLPRFQRDLVERILLDQAAFDIVLGTNSPLALASMLGSDQVDVVVVWARRGDVVETVLSSLAIRPELGVVLLADSGEIIARVHQVQANESWATNLINAIRG